MKNLSANTAKYSLIQANDATGLHIQDDGGNGLFIKDGGNIGIGTSAPDVKLAVVGTTSANAYTFYQNALTDASEAIHRPTTGQLAIRANSQERVRIDASGNVGIGTSSPGALLHLNGGPANNQAIFESTDGTSSILFKDPSGTAEFGNKGDSAVIMPAGVEKMRITSDGKIGIGITEPKHELHIYNTTSAPRIRLQCGNSSNAALLFGDAGDDTEAGILWNAATESLAIRGYNNTDRITILNNGNVGVGTVIPDVRLVVADNHPGDDVALRVWNSSTTDNSTTSLRFTNTSSTNYDHGYIIAGRTPSPYMQFGVADSVTAMHIDGTGNVGVGTTSPDYTLEVKKSVENWVSRIYNTGSTTGSAGLLVRSDASDFDSHAFGVHTGGSYKLSVRCDGKIGIGTTSPQAPLHIVGNVSGDTSDYEYAGLIVKSSNNHCGVNIDTPENRQAHIRFMEGGSERWQIRVPSHFTTSTDPMGPNSLRFYSWTTNTDVMNLDSEGNLGVGTVNPIYVYSQTGGSSCMSWVSPQPGGTREGWTSASGGSFMVAHDANTNWSNVYLNRYNYSNGMDGRYIDFLINGNGIGASISANSSANGVNYNTGSDRRLKGNIEDMTDGKDVVMQLRPRRFIWKSSHVEGDGFIADELSQVIPHAVTGEPDATNDDGTPKYQGVDYSKVVPVLTGALQQALQEIEQLKTRIETLENK